MINIILHRYLVMSAVQAARVREAIVQLCVVPAVQGKP